MHDYLIDSAAREGGCKNLITRNYWDAEGTGFEDLQRTRRAALKGPRSDRNERFAEVVEGIMQRRKGDDGKDVVGRPGISIGRVAHADGVCR